MAIAMERMLTALVGSMVVVLIIVVATSDDTSSTTTVTATGNQAVTSQLDSKINIKLSEFSWDRSKGNLPSECLYEYGDLTKLVPDKCCDPSAGATQTDSWSTTTENICTSRPLGGTPDFIRDWAGCYTDSDGKKVPAMAELCIPPQYSFGTTYPMSKADSVAPGVEGDYTLTQCKCGQNGDQTVPTTYAGVGCHVAVSPYQLGNTAYTIAFFAKVEGSCGN